MTWEDRGCLFSFVCSWVVWVALTFFAASVVTRGSSDFASGDEVLFLLGGCRWLYFFASWVGTGRSLWC